MNEIKKTIYTYEFSIIGEHYFPEQDYVLITTNPDEERMEALTNYFHTHNQAIYCCEDAFIIPQSTYDNVLKPLLQAKTTETVIYEQKGGEN